MAFRKNIFYCDLVDIFFSLFKNSTNCRVWKPRQWLFASSCTWVSRKNFTESIIHRILCSFWHWNFFSLIVGGSVSQILFFTIFCNFSLRISTIFLRTNRHRSRATSSITQWSSIFLTLQPLERTFTSPNYLRMFRKKNSTFSSPKINQRRWLKAWLLLCAHHKSNIVNGNRRIALFSQQVNKKLCSIK